MRQQRLVEHFSTLSISSIQSPDMMRGRITSRGMKEEIIEVGCKRIRQSALPMAPS